MEDVKIKVFFEAHCGQCLEKMGYDLEQEAEELKEEFSESPQDFPLVRDYQTKNKNDAGINGYRAEYIWDDFIPNEIMILVY